MNNAIKRTANRARNESTELERFQRRAARYGVRVTKFRSGYRVWLPNEKPSVMLPADGVRLILRCLEMMRQLRVSRDLLKRAEEVDAAYKFGKIDYEAACSLHADIDAGFAKLERRP